MFEIKLLVDFSTQFLTEIAEGIDFLDVINSKDSSSNLSISKGFCSQRAGIGKESWSLGFGIHFHYSMSRIVAGKSLVTFWVSF